MIEERDLIRHLETGGDELWNRPEPPALDIAAITGAAPRQRARRGLSLPSLRLTPVFAVGGALACTALGIGAGAVLFSGADAVEPEPARTPAVQLALEPGKDGPRDARATVGLYFGENGTTAEMSATGLPDPEPGTYYEVWAINSEGDAVSLGRLPTAGEAEVHAEMPVPKKLRNYRRLAVSIEPEDGDPAPSGRSVLQSVTSTS